MKDLTKALSSLYPNSRWSLLGEEYSGLTWISEDIPKPTEEELFAECDRLLEVAQANQYKQIRAKEYPLITDQLDMLWHMMNDETIPGKNSTWYNTIKEVKDNNPK